MSKLVSNKAIYTVLRYLGMSEKLSELAMVHHIQHLVPCSTIEDFEEIRHHEIAFIYPKVYRQRKYLGE